MVGMVDMDGYTLDGAILSLGVHLVREIVNARSYIYTNPASLML